MTATSLQEEISAMSDADLELCREKIKKRVSDTMLSSVFQATQKVAEEYLIAIDAEIERRKQP